MRRLSSFLLLAVIAAACSGAEPPDETGATSSSSTPPTTGVSTTVPTTVAPDTIPPPDPNIWIRTSLADAGFDAARFDQAISIAEAVDSHCFVVLRDGHLIHEQYSPASGPDVDHEVFSVTKSVTAAIVGAAQTMGALDITEPASTYLAEWDDTDSASVTIRQILQNTSGRFYDAGPDLFELGGKADMTQHSIDLAQQVDPDTAWFYNQSAIQTLDEILERATGDDPADFAEEHLFSPLGMSVSFRRDTAGNIPLFAGLQAGCLDLARFGALALQGGQWGDEQIIDTAFMAEATSGRTDLNRAYGYLFWANAPANTWDHTDPRLDRSQPYWPDLPLNAFGANGLGAQFSMVIPDERLVVVRIGPPSGIQGYEGVLANDLAAAVLASLAN